MDASKNVAIWSLLEKLGEGKGFAAASIDLDKDLPACSRQIKQLEKSLGIKLIDHHRRPAQLTNEALRIMPAVRGLLRSFEVLENSIQSVKQEEVEIYFSIPVNISRNSFRKSLAQYKKLDPKFKVHVLSDMDHQDLLERKVDLVCLPYCPPTEGLIVWPAYKAVNLMAATPVYIQQHGNPQTPYELKDHQLILRESRHYPMTRYLVCDSEKCPLGYKEIIFSGDVLTGKEMLLAGEGISVDLSISSIENELKTGEVVPVLPGWHRPAWAITFAIRRESLSNSRLVRFAIWLKEKERTAYEKRKKSFVKEGFLKPT